MSAPNIQIEKLDDSNYDSWSILMRSILIHGGYWNIVNGDLKNDDDKRKLEWRSNDEKALATIYLGVQPAQLIYIRECKSSNEAWEKLQEVHRPKGPIQKVTLYKRLVNHALAPGGDVLCHINEFAEVNAKLAENGISIQEELLVIMLLSSLPSEYENFVIAMETRDELPKLNALKQKLLEEGRRRKEKDEYCETVKQQAFVVKSNSKQDNKGSYNRKTPKTFKGKCFICGGVGHYASKCEKKSQRKSSSESMALLATADCKSFSKAKWYVDSGATSHMCNQKEMFIRYVDHSEEIALAGNKHILAIGKGDVKIFNNDFEILLKNVLYSPDLQANFISINKCVENGYIARFDKIKAEICRKTGETVIIARRKDNMFIAENELSTQMLCSAKPTQSDLWHNRYGHLNNKSLHDLSNKQMVKGMELKVDTSACCNTCMLSKIHVLTFPKESTTSSNLLLEVVHSDVCGPFRVKSVGGSSYFLTFIDDMSRKIYIYFLKHKSEVLEKFKMYKLQVEKQTGRKIKTLRSDNGGEFINRAFDEFLAAEGIKRQLTVPYTPQQNGVAERANRTLIEMARSMIIHAGVNHNLWAEAVNTAVYIRNRCPTKKLENKTPYEVWTGRKPNVSHFKVFGCSAVGLNKSSVKSKFDAKGRQYLMVGYSNTSKAYRLFDTNTQKVEEKRDVLFNENLYPAKMEVVKNYKSDADYLKIYNQEEFLESNNEADLNDDVEAEDNGTSHEDSFNTADEQENSTEEEENMNTVEAEVNAADGISNLVEVRSRGRPKIIRDGKPGRPRKQYCTKTVNELCVAIEDRIPHTVEEALTGTCKQFWEQAMKEEFTALNKNKTWTLEDLPKGHKAVPCKWVFALKRNVNGEIERYKARLVAKGCSQQYGVNYTETFSPVARYSTIRLLLALAVKNEMHLHQIDVKSAYLNSELSDEVYMKQPQHFGDSKFPNKVLRLRKAIYGLKQSGKEWNCKLDGVLQKLHFVACKNEPCLYKARIDGNLVLIVVYVDDVIIGCSKISIVHKVKQQITKEFEVSDKGEINHFLGMEVQREGSTGSITLSQSQYIRDLLEQYGMQDCKSAAVPLDPGFQVKCDNDCEKVSQHDYQSLIGSLMYLAISSRPDILHSVSKLAQRNTDPHIEHYEALKRVLRYLSGTADMKLIYKKNDEELEGFVDADWGGNSMDRKSYTGFTFFLGGNLVSWESRKQSSVALSSTEAEYMAASDAAKEAVYLKRLLKEISIFDAQAITLNIDNQGALKLAENPVYHKRSKHIDIKYHHIRELVIKQEIKLKYCQTAEMIADIMTKNLSKIKHYYFVNKLKLNL